jgi:hypothetical protein
MVVMGRIETLLELSMGQYLELLERLKGLAADSGPEQIEGLLDLQRQSRQTDGELLPLLIAGGAEWAGSPLLQRRLELLEAVLAEQQRQLPLLLERKAIFAAELGQLKTGQVAMSGYRMGGDQRGSVVHRSC